MSFENGMRIARVKNKQFVCVVYRYVALSATWKITKKKFNFSETPSRK